MRRFTRLRAVLVTAMALFAGPVVADDVTGSDQLLCAGRNGAHCTPADCAAISLDEFNVPEFVEIDLDANVIRTTKASGEARSTPIQNSVRQDGNLYLQGIEMGRAWSFLVVEATGRLTVSVAREGLSVTFFGVCTPLRHEPR